VSDYLSIARKTLATRTVHADATAATGQQQETGAGEESWIELWSNASALLNREGVRIMRLGDGFAIGVWSDRDSAEIREALRILDMTDVPIHYLDGDNVPDMYKGRDVAGEPVPNAVRHAMEKHPYAPWAIRDQMLAEIGWCPEGMTWEEWRMTTPASSERVVDRAWQSSEPAPAEKVDLISQYAVNAINAVIHTQLDLYSGPEAAEGLAPDEMKEGGSDLT